MSSEHFDTLIIGAGVSGIGAACHLKMKCPGKTFAIIERRQAIGGTWDLFKYPGIRSDSDMYTFGYSFRPWTENKVLASGPAIKQYVTDTAREYDVEKLIRFSQKVISCDWSPETGRWTIVAENETTGEKTTYTTAFVINATGYYDYDQGYRPKFQDEEKFKGDIIHPQKWPENYDYRNKKVVIIGSGATAITLVPAMAKDAAHVTMLQRSPTYIASIPSVDVMSAGLARFLPRSIVYHIGRARNIALQKFIWWASKNNPGAIKRMLLGRVKSRLGGAVDMKHFTPSYNPWDERMCVVPDGDLFEVIKSGEASIVTDHIEAFTKTGIKLKSGEELEADLIITATGLNVRMLGGVDVTVDGSPIEVTNKMTYKSVLFQDVPNAALIFGYTNASWTLKVDIAMEYLTRLLNYMDKNGYKQVVPRDKGNNITNETVMGGLNAGYLRRAADTLPKNGKSGPWRVNMDYATDAPMLRFAPIADDALEFSSELRPARKAQTA